MQEARWGYMRYLTHSSCSLKNALSIEFNHGVGLPIWYDKANEDAAMQLIALVY